MNMFVRAVVSGFGFSLGAALFRKVSDKLGLGEDKGGSNKSSKADPDVAVTGKDEQSERGEPALRS